MDNNDFTDADFANAEFARNPHDIGVGMRKDAGDPNTWCIAYEDPKWRIGIRTDAEMADGGWVPVQECPNPEQHTSQSPSDAEVAALIDSLAEQAGVFIMPLTASMALQDSRRAARRDEVNR